MWLRFFAVRSRHRLRWLLLSVAIGGVLIVISSTGNIPPVAAIVLLSLSAGAGAACYAAFRLERKAFLAVGRAADALEATWLSWAEQPTAATAAISHAAWAALIEPDFWSIAQAELVNDAGWQQRDHVAAAATANGDVTFHSVTEEERGAAPRGASFVASSATIDAPIAYDALRALSPQLLLAWPRCCEQPARLVGLVDQHGRPSADTEPGYLIVPMEPRLDEQIVLLADLVEEQLPTAERVGLECTRCGGRYAPRAL